MLIQTIIISPLYTSTKQWGYGSFNTLNATFNFSINFQKTCLSIVVSDVGSGCHVLAITYNNLNTYTVYQLQNVDTSFRYIVLGC